MKSSRVHVCTCIDNVQTHLLHAGILGQVEGNVRTHLMSHLEHTLGMGGVKEINNNNNNQQVTVSVTFHYVENENYRFLSRINFHMLISRGGYLTVESMHT